MDWYRTGTAPVSNIALLILLTLAVWRPEIRLLPRVAWSFVGSARPRAVKNTTKHRDMARLEYFQR